MQMIEDHEIRRLCCYAVLKNGYTGEDYFVPHMRLVLCLLSRQRIKTINIDRLVNDFAREYQYEISYFAMRRILGLALKKGYVSKNGHHNRFYPTSLIDEFANVDEEISSTENDVNRLALNFSQYAFQMGISLSDDESTNTIYKYVNSQKLNHMSGHIEDAHDHSIDYVFGRYVYELKEKKPDLFEVLNKMVLGSILTDCLVFHEELTSTKHLSGLSVALDTGFVFIALGIDEANRGEYYRNLLRDLQQRGAHTVMYNHSYDEMQQILFGARTWVESAEYDPFMASEATAYFRSINATQNDVDEFSSDLRNKIGGLNIEILGVEYEADNHSSVIDERELTERIIERYKEQNAFYNEAEKRKSVERDVRSVANVYLMRKSVHPIHLPDAKCIFVTTNQTLSKVATEFHKVNISAQCLSPIVTDTFMGTYLWLRDPVKIQAMNEQRIIAQAYLAFQPSPTLQKKLKDTAKELLRTGIIDSDKCYVLMSNKLVLDKICEAVHGDPDEFTEQTPLQVLQEIQLEAEQRGIEKERQKSRIIQQAKDEEFSATSKKAREEAISRNKELIGVYANQISEYRDKRESENRKIVKAKNCSHIVHNMLIGVYAALGGLVLLAVYRIYKEDADLLSLLSIAFSIVSSIILGIFGKSPNPRSVINKIASSVYNHLCMLFHCSEQNTIALDEKVYYLEKRIRELESETEELQAS